MNLNCSLCLHLKKTCPLCTKVRHFFHRPQDIVPFIEDLTLCATCDKPKETTHQRVYLCLHCEYRYHDYMNCYPIEAVEAD